MLKKRRSSKTRLMIPKCEGASLSSSFEERRISKSQEFKTHSSGISTSLKAKTRDQSNITRTSCRRCTACNLWLHVSDIIEFRHLSFLHRFAHRQGNMD